MPQPPIRPPDLGPIKDPGKDPGKDPPRPPDGDPPRDKRCEKLLAELRKHCPDLVPAPPRGPGEVAEPVALTPRALTALFGEALARGHAAEVVIWHDADCEIALRPGRTRVAAADGVVAVSLEVETEQTGAVEVVVPFAVGSAQQPAGMIATTERRPRGPAIVVERWGEALVAAAWEALLDIAAVAAEGAGTDLDGTPLRAGALVASGKGLAVIPQARHEFEREAPA